MGLRRPSTCAQSSTADKHQNAETVQMPTNKSVNQKRSLRPGLSRNHSRGDAQTPDSVKEPETASREEAAKTTQMLHFV